MSSSHEVQFLFRCCRETDQIELISPQGGVNKKYQCGYGRLMIRLDKTYCRKSASANRQVELSSSAHQIMADTSLPDLSAIISSPSEADAPLAKALSILFEPSTILFSVLVPQLASSIGRESPIQSYTELIDISITTINTWDDALRAQFVGGHPRIGESHNLSKLSAKEQGASPTTSTAATPPEVIHRLIHLNACYEHKYPGLRYITFVNGRSRAAIAEEMEDALGISHSLKPEEPKLDSFKTVEVGGKEWRAEVGRATQDVGKIAKSRLIALGVE